MGSLLPPGVQTVVSPPSSKTGHSVHFVDQTQQYTQGTQRSPMDSTNSSLMGSNLFGSFSPPGVQRHTAPSPVSTQGAGMAMPHDPDFSQIDSTGIGRFTHPAPTPSNTASPATLASLFGNMAAPWSNVSVPGMTYPGWTLVTTPSTTAANAPAPWTSSAASYLPGLLSMFSE